MVNTEEVARTFRILTSTPETAFLASAPAPPVVWWAARRGDRLEGSWAANPMELIRFAEAYSDWDFYVQLNPSEKRHGKRCSAEDISAARWFYVDIDPAEGQTPSDGAYDEAVRLLKQAVNSYTGMVCEPFVIHSGRGRQLWYRHEKVMLRHDVGYKAPEPQPVTYVPKMVDRGCTVTMLPSIPLWRARQDAQRYWLRQLASRVVGHPVEIDPSVSDLPRLMRCPGTVNRKTGKVAFVMDAPVKEWKTYEMSSYGGIGGGTRHFPVYNDDHINSDLAYRILAYTPIDQLSFLQDHPTVQAAGTPWQVLAPYLSRTAADFLTFGTLEPGRHRACSATARSLAEAGMLEPEIVVTLQMGGAKCRPELTGPPEYFARTARDAVRLAARRITA